MASSTRARVVALTYPELFRTRETVIAETPARSATSLILLIFAVPRFASMPRAGTGGCPRRGQPPEYELERTAVLLVEDGLDLGVVDVRLVEPVEAGVDVLRERLAVDRVDRGVDALGADADGVLGDGAGLDAAVDGIELLLAGVVADGHDLLLVAGLLEGVEDALDGALVRAEEALEVGVRGHHRLGDVGRLHRIAGAVLDVHDLDVRVLGLHLVDEAVAPGDAGLRGLVVDDDRNLARVADQGGELVCLDARGGDVVGGDRGDGDVAVDARVEADDRDVRGLGLVQEIAGGLAVEGGEADRSRVAAQGRLQHRELLVDLGLRHRTLVRGRDAQLGGLVQGALLDGLPELVLLALRDDRDGLALRGAGVGRRRVGRGGARAVAGRCGPGGRRRCRGRRRCGCAARAGGRPAGRG